MSILDYKITREQFLEEKFNESKSWASLKTNKFQLAKWDKFLVSINQDEKPLLKELKEKMNEPDTYLFINRYVQYLINQDLRRASITLAVTVLRSWLASNGIMLHPEYIKRFVKYPKDIKEMKKPLTPGIIESLIKTAPIGMKRILLTLLSSGMRIGELTQVRVMDVDKTKNPVEVRLRAETTKGREERIAYISNEAYELIKPVLETREPEDYIFIKSYSPYSTPANIEERFGDLRRRCDLLETYQGGKRFHVNIHSFRAYFHTQATKILSGDIAHALLGHHKYLDQYFRLSDEDKSEMYHKLEPYLTVNNEARLNTILNDKDQQLKEMDDMKKDLEKQKAKIKRLEDST